MELMRRKEQKVVECEKSNIVALARSICIWDGNFFSRDAASACIFVRHAVYFNTNGKSIKNAVPSNQCFTLIWIMQKKKK